MIEQMVSFIVPVFNASKTLRKCVMSIAGQTYTSIEIILVDDGSTDDSLDICKQMATKDERIRVFHKINGGVSSARNVGLSASVGEFITFVDSDDYIDDNYAMTLVANSDGVDAVLSGLQFVNDNECLDQYKLKDGIGDVVTFLNGYNNEFNPVCMNGPCCKLFKKKIIEENNISFPEDLSLGEDTMFVLLYLKSSKQISTTSFVGYYYYRARPDSLFNSFRKDRYYICKKVYGELYNTYKILGVAEKGMKQVEKSYFTTLCSSIILCYMNNKNITKLYRHKLIEEFANDPIVSIFLSGGQASIHLKILSFILKHRMRYMVDIYFTLYGIRFKIGAQA